MILIPQIHSPLLILSSVLESGIDLYNTALILVEVLLRGTETIKFESMLRANLFKSLSYRTWRNASPLN